MEPIFIHHSMGRNEFSYAFDTIGNRNTAQEAGAERTYSVNDLNQYTSVTLGETVSSSLQYDVDGNATQIETSTGTWAVSYNAENRPVRFEDAGTQTVVDITKNVCELFNTSGNLSKYYGYTPFGAVSSSSGTNQPFQWSSEYYDSELGLVYYNYPYVHRLN